MKSARLFLSPVNLCFLCGLSIVAPAAAQDPAGVWNGITQAAFDAGKSATVSHLELNRDRIRITLSDGVIQFTQPVAGVVFGAAFQGHGRVQVAAPNPREEQQIRRFTGQDGVNLEFTEATFSFSDGTFDEVSKQVHWGGAPPSHLADLYQSRQREREDWDAQVVPRLFKSLLSADRKRTMFFAAELKTRGDWTLVTYDALSPETVSVGRWSEYSFSGGSFRRLDIVTAFPANGRSAEEAYRDPIAMRDFAIRAYQINANVSGNGELGATTRVQFDTRAAGERVLLFDLDSNLRVQAAKDEKGASLAFFQSRERKDNYKSYGNYLAVVLPETTQTGQAKTLEVQYGGKRVVRRVGDGSYFCESTGWYPAPLQGENFSSRADFELTFRVPKRFTLIASGDKTGETTDGGSKITTWRSPAPLTVAGFALGDYKLTATKSGSMDVNALASVEPDDLMKQLQSLFHNDADELARGPNGYRGSTAAVGTLNPAALTKTVAIEVANTLNVFRNYFGPLPYNHLNVTTIPYSYGQSWPMLLYLDEVSYLDSTQRHALGIQDQIRIGDFFRAHEASHQWWGHRVGWKSYHDQWLSEGFAQFSGNLYTQFRQSMKEYLNRIRLDKKELLEKDRYGHVYDLAGPIWMGRRLSSWDSPAAYDVVVYNKGGLVLHMLRMIMYDSRGQDPDAAFKAMMQDFCKTFENKAASTEDFKAIVEKHMNRTMDLDNNHRLDWFFNQYVYGIAIPHYSFNYQVQDAGGGKWKVSGTVTQSGVPQGWKDILPLYSHSSSGFSRLGWTRVSQPTNTLDVTLPFRPDKLSLNDFEDILADIKQ